MDTSDQITALLVMDMQFGTLSRLPDPTVFVNTVAKAIENARKHKLPIIYVVVGFRKGTPEINKNNKTFAASRERWSQADPDVMMKIDSKLTPAENEVVVIKRRISAFSGSDLEVLLRSYGTKHLVLTGFATSGVVLSTVREAADKDFQLTVLSDCCSDMDEEVHRVLTTKVFARQAEVMTVEDWIKTF
jgi:Amidases related to nicotinamidase